MGGTASMGGTFSLGIGGTNTTSSVVGGATGLGKGGTSNTGGTTTNTTGAKASGGNSEKGGSTSAGGLGTGGKATGGISSQGGSTNVGGASNAGTTSTGTTSPHMYTKGSDLYASCGEKVLLRGVNQMSVWTDATGSSYPAIASFGTNAIRIVYVETGTATGLDVLLTKAEENKMIPMPELHDATGKFDEVAKAVTWWTQASVVSVIKKHEKWMLLNIANEAGDSSVSDATFQSSYTSAIESLRSAGITVPIVIDATGWGQKVEQLLTAAPALLAADPQKNVIFSWHEYTGGASEKTRITASLEKSKQLGIVLVNGEFASGGASTCTEDIPYQFLMAEAERVGTGWLAWSWDTSNSDCKTAGASIFNMTSNLTSANAVTAGWAANVLRDDPNSIKNTSHRYCDWK
jgi:mannan endo-1,4-beta-mannosidase